MNDEINADAKKLVSDIFLLTGQKVEVGDPIVVAALIQSALIRRAGLDAVAGINAVMAKSLGELADAVKVTQEAVDTCGGLVGGLRRSAVRMGFTVAGLVLLGVAIGAGLATSQGL